MLFKTIYLADDDADDVDFFSAALIDISKDYNLNISNNGEELLDQLENSNANLPDIIFIDVNMPKMGGLEALQAIRSNTQFNDIPVVIYSTSSNELYIKRAYALGAGLYFVKPMNYAQLREKISFVLSGKWQEQALPQGQVL